MSQIGILTPTQQAFETPRQWIRNSEAQRLVSLKQLVMLSKRVGRLLVAKAAESDSQRFSTTACTLVRMGTVMRVARLPVREWRQSLDLNYPEIGRESNALLLRHRLWARAYPALTEHHLKQRVGDGEDE